MTYTDRVTESIGMPINPHRHAKQSKKSEFWTDFLEIFTGADDPVGFVRSILLAILFVLKWGIYLIGARLFRLKLNKPKVKHK